MDHLIFHPAEKIVQTVEDCFQIWAKNKEKVLRLYGNMSSTVCFGTIHGQ
jgi:predicted naringenin-chalcone synthase